MRNHKYIINLLIFAEEEVKNIIPNPCENNWENQQYILRIKFISKHGADEKIDEIWWHLFYMKLKKENTFKLLFMMGD